MAKTIRRQNRALKMICDDPSDEFFVGYTNEGEPFREGIMIGVRNSDFDKDVTVMLESREAISLRDYLNKMFPLEEGDTGKQST